MEDIKHGKCDISIASSDFPSYTLYITQHILDIQKDKASEDKVKNILPFWVKRKLLQEKLWMSPKDL